MKQLREKAAMYQHKTKTSILKNSRRKIEEKFAEAIEIARTSGISLDKLTDLLTLMYQEDDGE